MEIVADVIYKEVGSPDLGVGRGHWTGVPIQQLRLRWFDGKLWVLFGEAIGNWPGEQM
jgi:hypothetical protein